jgi:hypothetical protein
VYGLCNILAYLQAAVKDASDKISNSVVDMDYSIEGVKVCGSFCCRCLPFVHEMEMMTGPCQDGNASALFFFLIRNRASVDHATLM